MHPAGRSGDITLTTDLPVNRKDSFRLHLSRRGSLILRVSISMNRYIPTTSAPIEIPSRNRSTPSSQVSYLSPSQTATQSPELLFEMSPVEVETEVQSSFHSLTLSVSRWNRDHLFSFPKKYPGTLVNHTQPESQQQSNQAASSPKYPNTHSSCNDWRTNCEKPVSRGSAPALTITPPIIRTVAVHKIAGFQPERSEDLQSNSCHIPIVKDNPRPSLTPSDSSLSVTLPWLLPGTKDGDDDDYYYLSQSPAFFDFKKFLICRADRQHLNRSHRWHVVEV